MSCDSRREKAAAELNSLEREFEASLRIALADCADGAWGLFESNPPAGNRIEATRSEGRRLVRLGEEISAARLQAGIVEEFWMFARFQHYRSMRDSNDMGEPRRAVAFLAEIDSRPRPI